MLILVELPTFFSVPNDFQIFQPHCSPGESFLSRCSAYSVSFSLSLSHPSSFPPFIFPSLPLSSLSVLVSNWILVPSCDHFCSWTTIYCFWCCCWKMNAASSYYGSDWCHLLNNYKFDHELGNFFKWENSLGKKNKFAKWHRMKIVTMGFISIWQFLIKIPSSWPRWFYKLSHAYKEGY